MGDFFAAVHKGVLHYNVPLLKISGNIRVFSCFVVVMPEPAESSIFCILVSYFTGETLNKRINLKHSIHSLLIPWITRPSMP